MKCFKDGNFKVTPEEAETQYERAAAHKMMVIVRSHKQNQRRALSIKLQCFMIRAVKRLLHHQHPELSFVNPKMLHHLNITRSMKKLKLFQAT